MGTPSVQGTGNGQVPGFQEGGSMSQQAIDKMSNDQLVNLSKTGSDIDKKNAVAELTERLGGGPEKGEKGEEGEKGEKGAEKGEKAGGAEKPSSTGSSSLDEDLKKILEKLAKGEPLTPEEEQKLKAALGGGNDPSSQSISPDKIGDPQGAPPQVPV